MVLQVAPPTTGTDWQEPEEHRVEQQSPPEPQEAPVCLQVETEQVPLVQMPLQHSRPVPQDSPEPLQMATQLPALHTPEQHGALSESQAVGGETQFGGEVPVFVCVLEFPPVPPVPQAATAAATRSVEANRPKARRMGSPRWDKTVTLHSIERQQRCRSQVRGLATRTHLGHSCPAAKGHDP
jgi:hypothetical protein